MILPTGLEGLDSLILGHNQLKEVPARVFSHLNLLNSLELDGNQINHIHSEAFFGLEGLYNQVYCSLSPVFFRQSYRSS
jgi:Leucine-rich repeat (LRR) protein